jgi:hypothetical protein
MEVEAVVGDNLELRDVDRFVALAPTVHFHRRRGEK